MSRYVTVRILLTFTLLAWFKATHGQNTAEPETTYASKTEKVPDSAFVVFDGTSFPNKPDMTKFGFTPVEIIYQVHIWDKPRNKIAKSELPPKKKVAKLAHEASKVNSEIAIIDIEHWPTKGPKKQVKNSVAKYTTVYDWFKEAEPDMKFGYYDMVPVKNYWAYPSDDRLKIWRNRNDLLKPFAEKVDAFFPHLYASKKDKEYWVNSAEHYLKETRRISGGKPVYAFLWPQYLPRDESLKDVYIDAEFWRLQLETARRYADGVVIWFPHRTEWEEASEAPWWEVTKDFLRELGKDRDG